MVAADPHDAVRHQFGGALAMLRNAIEACPDELWAQPSERMGYWYLAYHTLFFVDFDLHPAGAPFASPEFDRFEYELNMVPPPYEVAYEKSDLLEYLDRCTARVAEVLRFLSKGDSVEVQGSRRLEISTFEVVLYELRHVQHHAAQLNARLRLEGVEPPGWVRRHG